MGKFRKKPIVIEAIEVRTSNHGALSAFVGSDLCIETHWSGGGMKNYFVIETDEGDMRAGVGDWIIKGIKGEFYPCKPDIFEATYEAVEEK